MEEHPRTFLARELGLIYRSEKGTVNDVPHTRLKYAAK